MAGPLKTTITRATILAILLCISGTAAQAQRKPSIVTQPVSLPVLAGQPARFSVAAAGTTPLAFQWYRNGVAISGATSSAYTISAAATSYSGSRFTAVVRNRAGTATTNAAVLTVNSPLHLLNSSSTNVAFGNVNISSSSWRSVLLISAGKSSVAISNVSVAGAGFNARGLSGIILSPGQTATLNVEFAPAAAASVTGRVTVTSNASNSPMTIALSGTGVAQTTYSVVLSWTKSTSYVAGYNVYSSEISGGPYTKLTTSPIAATNYTDRSVGTARTYYYVVTAVNPTNVESAYSAQISARVP